MMLLNRPISSYQDKISFNFRTNYANGNLIYSHGTQGDLFSLRLEDNKVVLSIDLSGHGQMNTITSGSLLDDSEWHSVLISRSHRDLNLTVDSSTTRHKISSDSSRLDLNGKVSCPENFLSNYLIGNFRAFPSNNLRIDFRLSLC